MDTNGRHEELGKRNRSRSPAKRRSSSRSPRRSIRRSRSPSNRRGKRDRERRSFDSPSKMAYISNIPYEMRWMELKDIIREKAGEVSFVEMIEKDGRAKGCAVVEFKSREGLLKCLDNMNQIVVEDRKIVVKEIRDPIAFLSKVREETGIDFLSRVRTSTGDGGGSRGGGFGSGRGGHRSNPTIPTVSPFGQETYGLSPTFLHQLHIEGPLCNRVFVANLPFSVSTGKVKEVFSLAGQVTDMDLQLDKEGKSKGICIVEFFHPIEAVQAVSMLNQQRLYDRQITVKMDRFEKAQEPVRPGELPAGLTNVGMGLGANGAPLTNVAQLVASGQFGPVAPFVSRSQTASPDLRERERERDRARQSSSTRYSYDGNNASLSRLDMSSQSFNPGLAAAAMLDYPPPQQQPPSSMGAGGGLAPASRLSMGNAGDSLTNVGSRLYTNSQSGTANTNADLFYGTTGGGVGDGRSISDVIGGGGSGRDRDRERDYSSRSVMGDRFMSTGAAGNAGGVGGGGVSSAAFYDQGGLASVQRGGGAMSPLAKSYGSAPIGGLGPAFSSSSINGGLGGGGGASGSVGGHHDSFGTRGFTADYDHYGPPTRSSSHTIVIRNLPLDYSWQTLRDRLKGFGDVDFADILQPGVGKVRFVSALDAEKATIHLHGMHVEGRAINVDMTSD